MLVEFLRRVGNTPRGTVRELPATTAVRLAGRGYVRPAVERPNKDVSEAVAASGNADTPRPDPADRKAVWVDYAVSCGVSREDAEGMTKARLQEV